MKEKKVIGPIIGCILFTALGLVLYMFIGAGIGGFIDGALKTNMIVAPIMCSIVSIIYALIYQKKNKPDFDGCFKSENMKEGFLILIPVIVFSLLTLVLAAILSKHHLGFSLSLALSAVYAGVCEEITFRAIPAAHMMRCYNDQKKIVVVMVLTSFFFSIIHAANIFSGADVTFTALQLLRAFTLGLLLCASYLRTGSIIPPIVLHFLNDFIVFFDIDMYSSTAVASNKDMLATQDFVVGIIFAVIFTVCAFYAVRPQKKEEIMSLWAKKWSKA